MNPRLTHYVPFLRAKAGESDAIKRLTLDIRHGITPFFDVPRSTEKETLDQKLEKASKYIIQAMGLMRVLFADTFDIPLKKRCNNGEHPVTVSLPREALSFCSKINLSPDKLDSIIDHQSVIAKEENVLLDQSVEAIHVLYKDCRYR